MLDHLDGTLAFVHSIIYSCDDGFKVVDSCLDDLVNVTLFLKRCPSLEFTGSCLATINNSFDLPSLYSIS